MGSGLQNRKCGFDSHLDLHLIVAWRSWLTHRSDTPAYAGPSPAATTICICASIIQWPGSLPSKQMMRVRFPLDAPLGNSTTASASGSDPEYVCSIHTSQPFMVYLVKSLRSGLEWFQRLSHKQVHAGPNPCLRNHWGYSSVGRASALQAECRRFDSVYLHHLSAPVAQLAEQQTLNLRVEGSTPSRSTMLS